MRFRTVAGALLIAAVALVVFLDGRFLPGRPLGSALMLLLALAGWWEFSRITGLSTTPNLPFRVVGGAAILYFFAISWLASDRPLHGGAEAWVVGGVCGLAFFALAAGCSAADLERGYRAGMETVFGGLILGLFPSYLVRIYHLPGWRGPVFWAILVAGVKGNDMAAYYVGKAWGRRHPFKVSPNKTLEGSLGAILFSTAWFGIAALVVEKSAPGSLFAWPGGMLFGVLISIVAQAGDLGESLIKRVYRVKDSGALLPEFGGVLDMVDSLTFAGFLFFGALSI